MAFNLGDALKGVSKLDTGREQIEYIRLDLIDDDPNNFYTLSNVEELADNIATCGLQQPIRVRPIADTARYIIVSGHRRRAAVSLLAKENPEQWQEVACIVARDEVSPALQQLQLIFANSNTRTMTSYETSQQAVQVEKLLYQLKEEGYEFPGRMRDHVAKAVNASKSKLARLKVIREKLSFSWRQSWESNKLSESVAYELAQLPAPWQDLIFAKATNISTLYAETVKKYARRFEELQETTCHGNTVCGHRTVMMEKSCADSWQDPCKARCCWECSNLRTCKSSCKAAAGKKKDQQSAYKADVKAEEERAAQRDKPTLDTIRLVYERVGAARRAAGVSLADLASAQGKRYIESTDRERFESLENGTAKLNTNTNLPFGYSFYASDVKALCSVADLLQCSTDYLLGRDVSTPDSGPELDTIWRTGNPEGYGTYATYIQIKGTTRLMLRELLWTGDEWLLHGEAIADDVTVKYWADRPEI